MDEKTNGAAIGIGCFVLAVYGIAQLCAGFIGIEHHFGTGWAIGAIVVAFGLRFTLPITVGAFFGAMNVWGWHWIFALIFAAPGIAFMMLLIPGVMAEMKKR